MKVSVALCTFNGERFLHQQLESILRQTVQPSELVVCDDCSDDATLEVLSVFKNSCGFPVKIIRQSENLWVTKNFETAIKHSGCEIIILADQDDIWHPCKIERIIKAFQDNPGCGYVFSNADLIDENGDSLHMDLWQAIGFNEARWKEYESGDQLGVMLRGTNLVYGMTMAFRSVYIQHLIPIESRAYECAHDTWIALLLSANGAYGVAVHESLVQYRKHEAQVTRSPAKNLVAVMGAGTHKGGGDLEYAVALENIAKKLRCEGDNKADVLHAKRKLLNKAKHLRACASATASNGIQRFWLVVREVVSGRNAEFSGTFQSSKVGVILRNELYFLDEFAFAAGRKIKRALPYGCWKYMQASWRAVRKFY